MRTGRAGAAYVLVVTALATGGFAFGSTAMILLAAVITLPTSIPAAFCFYLSYGVLALVPGANPPTASGSGSCSPEGVCETSTTGDPAAWFTLATDLVGVLALVAAALVNVVVVRRLVPSRRPVDDDFTGTPDGW